MSLRFVSGGPSKMTTPSGANTIIGEMAKLCENTLAPLYQSGDEEGCKFENGVVTTPKGYKEAYDEFVAGGWQGGAGAGGARALDNAAVPQLVKRAHRGPHHRARVGDLGHDIRCVLRHDGVEDIRQHVWTSCLKCAYAGYDIAIVVKPDRIGRIQIIEHVALATVHNVYLPAEPVSENTSPQLEHFVQNAREPVFVYRVDH